MARYIAFLRAINVAGRIVKMERLRALFEEIGFANVETFIASGNVIFESSSKSEEALRKKIENELQQALGYEVGVFLRSDTEVNRVANDQAYSASELTEEDALYIVFLATAPTPEAAEKLMEARNEVNDFKLRGRELFWLCRKKFSDSKFSGPRLEKTLGVRGTARNVTTVRKLAAKYQPSRRSATNDRSLATERSGHVRAGGRTELEGGRIDRSA